MILPSILKLKHLGVKYPCTDTECDYKATSQSHLTTHTNSKHLGVKYLCTECDHQATNQSNLKTHFDSKHAGIRYPCPHCEYKATEKVSPVPPLIYKTLNYPMPCLG